MAPIRHMPTHNYAKTDIVFNNFPKSKSSSFIKLSMHLRVCCEAIVLPQHKLSAACRSRLHSTQRRLPFPPETGRLVGRQRRCLTLQKYDDVLPVNSNQGSKREIGTLKFSSFWGSFAALEVFFSSGAGDIGVFVEAQAPL